MPRSREGGIIERDGRIYARVQWRDANGRVREKIKRARNRTHAKELKQKLLEEIKPSQESFVDAERMTFRELAAEYEKKHLVEAHYVGDRKVGGLRSLKSYKSFLKTLKDHFGDCPVQEITHPDIEEFRLKRLSTPIEIRRFDQQLDKFVTVESRPRAISSVNRELELLRAILNFARRKRWLRENPFEVGDPLISKADETVRERLLTDDEEKRLLAACTGRRKHLRPIIIAARDTALRRGELFKLKWSDIDLTAGVIRLRATTTKTLRKRTVGITKRLAEELQRLWEASPQNPDALVFGLTEIKRSFATACRKAGIEDLHFHDLRGRASTEMIEAGVPAKLAQKATGHTQEKTFNRYVKADDETARVIATALDQLREAKRLKEKGSKALHQTPNQVKPVRAKAAASGRRD